MNSYKLEDMTEEYVMKASWAINEAQQKLNTSFGGATGCFSGIDNTEQMLANIAKAEALIEMRQKQIADVEFELNIMRQILADDLHITARQNAIARWDEKKGA